MLMATQVIERLIALREQVRALADECEGGVDGLPDELTAEKLSIHIGTVSDQLGDVVFNIDSTAFDDGSDEETAEAVSTADAAAA